MSFVCTAVVNRIATATASAAHGSRDAEVSEVELLFEQAIATEHSRPAGHTRRTGAIRNHLCLEFTAPDWSVSPYSATAFRIVVRLSLRVEQVVEVGPPLSSAIDELAPAADSEGDDCGGHEERSRW